MERRPKGCGLRNSIEEVATRQRRRERKCFRRDNQIRFSVTDSWSKSKWVLVRSVKIRFGFVNVFQMLVV